jgi:pimeloyl-ACP methyl ester carboxylesterase
MRLFAVAIVALVAMPVAAQPAALAPAASLPVAVWADPAPDAAHPAAMVSTQIESHGAMMNAVVYTPSGPGPHPAMLLLHGFPGHEQNLDLALAARRQGWVVLTLHYRGSWGSSGNFSFTHVVEDAEAAYDWLVAPAQRARFAIDPARTVVAGHSMGGFAVTLVGAARPAVAGVLLIDAWNPGIGAKAWPANGGEARAAKYLAGAIAPLAGTSGDALAAELGANKERFDLVNHAVALAGRPLLSITAERGLAAENMALTSALQSAGARALTAHRWATDHSFSDTRIRLISTSLEWLHQFEAVP